MMDQLIPEDSTQDDTFQHKDTRRLANQPIGSDNDREFTQDEVRQTIESSNPRKEPELDGVIGEILTYLSKHTPNDNRDV